MNNSQDGQTAFDRNHKPDFAKIEAHYNHAREKHPRFCDQWHPYSGISDFTIAKALVNLRNRIKTMEAEKRLVWDTVLDCEIWEIREAIACGQPEYAVEECYDAIAVLLRVIDVLEGRQLLGKPKEGAE